MLPTAAGGQPSEEAPVALPKDYESLKGEAEQQDVSDKEQQLCSNTSTVASNQKQNILVSIAEETSDFTTAGETVYNMDRSRDHKI